MTYHNVVALIKRLEQRYLDLVVIHWLGSTPRCCNQDHRPRGMTSDPPRALPLVAQASIPWHLFCISSETIFIKKEEVTEKRIIGTRLIIPENNLADRFICLEINEVISFKINSPHLWMTTNKLARFLPFR